MHKSKVDCDMIGCPTCNEVKMSDDIDTMDRMALRNECLALKEKLRVAVEAIDKADGSLKSCVSCHFSQRPILSLWTCSNCGSENTK